MLSAVDQVLSAVDQVLSAVDQVLSAVDQVLSKVKLLFCQCIDALYYTVILAESVLVRRSPSLFLLCTLVNIPQ